MAGARRLLVGTALAVMMALAACGGGDDSGGDAADDTPTRDLPTQNSEEFGNREFGFTFRYPDDLELGRVNSVDKATSGEPAARQALFLDEDNGILLSRYDLDAEVTDDNLDDVHAEVDGVVTQLTGLDVTGRRTTVGGFIAFQYDDLDIDVPPNGSSDLTFLFDGTTEYQINCQSTPENRARIDDACRLALDTLERA